MQPKPRIQTLADQQALAQRLATPSPEWLAQEEAKRAAMAQAAAQAQPAMQQTSARMPFPGSNPDMGEPGLLAQTMDRIGQFFGGDKTLAVPAERNPLAAAPGVGIGGEARRKAVDEEVERASGGKRR